MSEYPKNTGMSPDEPPPLPARALRRASLSTAVDAQRSVDEPPPLPPGFGRHAVPLAEHTPTIPPNRVSAGMSRKMAFTSKQIAMSTTALGGSLVLLLIVVVTLKSKIDLQKRINFPPLPPAEISSDASLSMESQLKFGDPPTPHMIAWWNQRSRLRDEDTEIPHLNEHIGSWDGNGDFFGLVDDWQVWLVYGFQSNKLVEVRSDFNSVDFVKEEERWTKILGCPQHYTLHPNFTTQDGSIHQNEVVGWHTDRGDWELYKFDTSLPPSRQIPVYETNQFEPVPYIAWWNHTRGWDNRGVGKFVRR